MNLNKQKKMEVKRIEISAAEWRELEALREEKAKREAREAAKADRAAYKDLADEAIVNSVARLTGVSNMLKGAKEDVLRTFDKLREMKEGVLKVRKDNQRSDTYTHSDGKMRVTVGQYVTDNYRDTVEDGIAIVREYIEGLAQDDASRALVRMVMKLLSRDAKGTLKASRVMQLRKMAEESCNDRFLEGVVIIEESYQPSVSKTYVKVETKSEHDGWKVLPLGMTEA